METDVSVTRKAPERFARFCAAIARRIPFVAPTFVGFALINSTTYGIDLLLLTLLHGYWQMLYPVAVAVAYAIALSLSFILNRVFNFRSHAPVGRQSLIYLVAVAINFGILVGVSSALEASGVQYQLARIGAGACEGVFMYCAMRWAVFTSRSE